jgi:hypothetical protein
VEANAEESSIEAESESLTASSFSICRANAAIGFSANGRYVLLERCSAAGRHIVRIDRTTLSQKLVVELLPDEFIGGYWDQGTSFTASVYSRGSGSSSDLVADWDVRRVLFTRGKHYEVVKGGDASSSLSFGFDAMRPTPSIPIKRESLSPMSPRGPGRTLVSAGGRIDSKLIFAREGSLLRQRLVSTKAGV